MNAGSWVETERAGRPVRHLRVAVSAGAHALAWARQEDAPSGAGVLVDAEVSPLGRLGRLWHAAPESTFACAVVLRPQLAIDAADVMWLVGGVAAADAVAAVGGAAQKTWWPDLLVDGDSGDRSGMIKAEVQLGPGRIRSAVVTVRLDLDRLGLDGDARGPLLDALLDALTARSEDVADGTAGVVAAYERRCALLERRIKVALLPKGETRGFAGGIDGAGRLKVTSATGMVERVGIDVLRSIELVDDPASAGDG